MVTHVFPEYASTSLNNQFLPGVRAWRLFPARSKDFPEQRAEGRYAPPGSDSDGTAMGDVEWSAN